MTDLQLPRGLHADERRIWADLVEEAMAAGVHGRLTPTRLRELTSAIWQHERASNLIAASDIVTVRGGVDDGHGNVTGGIPIANPALKVQADAAKRIATLRKELGLTRAVNTRDDPDAPMATNSPMSTPGRQPLGRWCPDHKRYECISQRTRNQGPCHDRPAMGKERCRKHVGIRLDTDPEHILAQERARNPMAGEPMNIGPAEALLWRVKVYAGEIARLDDLIAMMERDELVWGTMQETEEDTDAGTTRRTVKGARMSMWLVIRSDREERLHRACEAALRANIEDRLVRLAEQEGAMLHRVMLTILGDFGISPADPRIAEIIPRRIRELTAS